MRSNRRFSHHEIHRALAAKLISPEYHAENAKPDGFVQPQALHCPYYVDLDGVLGSDWGVIVNPESTRFGMLTFEHDYCGCPPHVSGQQLTDEWLDKVKTRRDLARIVASIPVPTGNATAMRHYPIDQTTWPKK
jgi:hypothetical protein